MFPLRREPLQMFVLFFRPSEVTFTWVSTERPNSCIDRDSQNTENFSPVFLDCRTQLLQRIDRVFMQPAGKWIPALSAMPEPESATVVRGWTCMKTFSDHRGIRCLLLFRVCFSFSVSFTPFVSCVRETVLCELALYELHSQWLFRAHFLL